MDVNSNASMGLFKGTGKIVSGDRFVGRDNELSDINQTSVVNRANLAVVGMPRVGKSSLVWQGLVRDDAKKELFQDYKIVVVYIDCSTINLTSRFYHLIGSKLIDELKRNYDNCPGLNSYVDENIAEYLNCIDNNPRELDSLFPNLFEELFREYKISVICVLDEFDKVKNFFETKDFMRLREAAYTSEALSYVTISRKSITEIEAKGDTNISNFHGTFSSYIYLKNFAPEDMGKYWKRLKDGGFELSDVQRESVLYIAGRHPIFLDLCCEQYYKEPDCELLQKSNIRQKLNDEFNQMLEILKGINDKETGCNLLDKLKQIIIGPVVNVPLSDINKLSDLGVIELTTLDEKARLLSLTIDERYRPKGKNCYILFSGYFTQLFYAKYFLDTEYWPLWGETENRLRKLVEFFLINRYGDNWQESIEEENSNDSNWMDSWNKMKKRCETSKAVYTNVQAISEITFSETGELYFLFIKKYFNIWFNRIFTPISGDELGHVSTYASAQITTWSSIFDFLMKIRRPYAHSSVFVLSDHDAECAKIYCELVKNKITAWENAGSSRPAKYNPCAVPSSLRSGVLKKDFYGKLKIWEQKSGFYYVVFDSLDGLEEGDCVSFELSSRPNKYDESKEFYFAVNVKKV